MDVGRKQSIEIDFWWIEDGRGQKVEVQRAVLVGSSSQEPG